jgi:hypothetical protein
MTAYENPVAYYSSQAPMTDPGELVHMLAGLPKDVPGLVGVVQNNLVHRWWLEANGLNDLPEDRLSEVNLRPTRLKLQRLAEMDIHTLVEGRPLGSRLVNNCRDFTVMIVSLLRHQGYAARSRCGFGTYFTPGKYEDHWVAEYWQAGGQRWVMLDAQLDELQLKALGIRFDPLDMPPGRFVTGGEAWRLARAGKADPDLFGIFEWKGWNFIKGTLLRDLLALNRFEVLPWDFWGMVKRPHATLTQAELDLLDETAQACVAADYQAVRSIYDQQIGRAHV